MSREEFVYRIESVGSRRKNTQLKSDFGFKSTILRGKISLVPPKLRYSITNKSFILDFSVEALYDLCYVTRSYMMSYVWQPVPMSIHALIISYLAPRWMSRDFRGEARYHRRDERLLQDCGRR